MQTMPSVADALTTTLKNARSARRISQLELALRIGVSQRHVSFVEIGRAKPSRHLLMNWLQELQAPLGLRNVALLQAGYAPAYSDRPMTDTALAPAIDALQQLLTAHDPLPAFVLDAQWNVLNANAGARWLCGTLMPALWPQLQGGGLNMLDALAHSQGLLPALLNLHEVAGPMLAHLRDSAAAQPQLMPQVDKVAAAVQQRLAHIGQKGQRLAAPLASGTGSPVLTNRFASAHGTLSFFSMFSTFGSPQDITLASLRVEHLFATDTDTTDILKRNVPPALIDTAQTAIKLIAT